MKKAVKRIALAVAVCLMALSFTACSGGKAAKLEFAYSEPASASTIEMENYNGMDLTGMDMYRFSSFTFDTYTDGTYVLKVTSGLAYNSLSGVMGGTATTYFGTYEVKAASQSADNTEYVYTLSVPTRVISAKDVSYVGSGYTDSDGGEASAVELLRDGKYYSEVTVDREACTVIDKVQSSAN